MKIKRHKKFRKKYQKLSSKWQKKVDNTLLKFANNPFDQSLYNHQLFGKYKSDRSISVSGNFRLVFREKDDYVVVEFLTMGTHSQLYKK